LSILLFCCPARLDASVLRAVSPTPTTLCTPPPPPPPPPFPYTTLFRSATVARYSSFPARVAALRRSSRETVPGSRELGRNAATRDRKSTRLNSSHVSSSYGVVCWTHKRGRDLVYAEQKDARLRSYGCSP